MPLRDWFRPPRQVLAIFLTVAVVSTGALGGLAWQLSAILVDPSARTMASSSRRVRCRRGRSRDKDAPGVPKLIDRFELTPEKTELFGGRLYATEEERLTMLALLLENVGIDKAVRLNPYQLR